MDVASNSHHKSKLASFCRRCGNASEFNTETSRHKPKRASEFMKELLAVDNLDVSSDVETKHPPFLCRCCFMKLDRYRKSKNRNDKVFVMFSLLTSLMLRERGFALLLCSFVLRRSPRKRGNISDPIPNMDPGESSSRAGPGGKKSCGHVRQIFSGSSPSSSADSENTKKQIPEEEPTTLSHPFEGDTYELTSIPLERFQETHFAQIFQCNICLNIPTVAVVVSNCHHFFFEHCLQLWLACNGVCPACRQCVDLEQDILPLRQHMLAVFNLLTVSCKYSENG